MLKYLFILFLFCTPTFADPCDFIRGDANDDGLVNLSDVITISTMSQVNDDAADVDDNGSVNGLDAVHLANWLVSSGPPPAPPFPASGLDCTEDYLETPCSIPSSPESPSFGSLNNVDIVGTFDQPIEGWSNLHTIAKNNSVCDRTGPTVALSRADQSVDDNTGYTKDRIDAGVQTAELQIRLYFFMEPGHYCDPFPCTAGVNELGYDLQGTVVKLGHTLGASIEVEGTWSSVSESITYERTVGPIGRCNYDGYNPWFFMSTFTSSNLAGQIADSVAAPLGQDLGEITEIEVEDVAVFWDDQPNGAINAQDISYEEIIQTWFKFDHINYEWCEVE